MTGALQKSEDGFHFSISPRAQQLVLKVVDTWGSWFEHPYMKALFEGSLDEEQFLYALQQEQLLLHGHLEAASLLLTRKQDLEEWDMFQQGLAWVRQQVELEDEPALIAPETLAYRNFLFTVAFKEQPITGLLVWIVHIWLRAEVAHFVARRMPEIDEEHPYFSWLRAGRMVNVTAFLDAIMERIDQEEAGEKVDAHVDMLFARSVCYEWRLLEQAWKQMHWNCPDLS